MTWIAPAVAAVALVACGCGSADRDPNLAQAAEKTEATGSSSFALRVVETDATAPEIFECEGAADYAARRMRIDCGDDGEYVAVEDVYYVRGWSLGFGLPRDKPWLRIPIDADDSPHDFAPGTLLARLRAASVETERLGEETVRGVETFRYRMTVACSDAGLDCSSDTTDVAVWVDGDGLVRRVAMQDGTADVKAEYFDFGRSVQVDAPPEGQVADFENPRLEPCRGGGEPISDVELRRALRAHGFQAPDRDGGECVSGVAAMVAAVVDTGARGAVVCYVYATDAGGPSSVEESTRGGLAGYQLRNVACSSYGRSTEGPVAARLRAALGDLE